MHDDTERWRRLTILDMLCLFPSFGLGAATVRYLMDHPTPDPVNPRPWPMDASLFSLTFVALVLGSVYAAPLSLAIQFIFRRRRAWLSIGEWLWLEPLFLYGFTYTASNIGRPTPVWFFLAIAIQFASSTLAFGMLGIYSARLWKGEENHWTDFLGCIACVFFGIMLIYLETMYPTYI